MSKPSDGGAAFPLIPTEGCGPIWEGMSLRDWFAGQALNGMVASEVKDAAERFARGAYALADAMIAERNKERDQ